MIDGLVRLMESSEKVTGPVNLGNPEEYSIIELTRQICDLTGSPSKYVFKPLPQDDPTQRKPDISLAKKALGWEPVIPVKEGLKLTIEYFRQMLERGEHPEGKGRK